MKYEDFGLLTQFKKMHNAYMDKLSELSIKENLMQIELTILGFLNLNPQTDTAKDIEAAKLLKKSNISKAVDHLIERGLINRRQDEKDRRIIHLEITENAKEIAEDICAIQKEFFTELFQGISKEELQTYFEIHKKICDNINRL